ncbi:hypothetical protein [Mycolicibacterium sediminis]|uniref:Uncharacterized protein n=1 Tax=Mycolicibacterium sediminis TaxID=1286180 RepID=A0A7I7QZE1_9MYCO|nr:hypothetical protein [Mycolicibacterium sediminis]BBY31655.1 hypothetical protein MSEDJ_57510 [Mycolicibacterium sediminis]
MADPTDADVAFAADVLRNLLHRIEAANANAATGSPTGRYAFLVSHAWTDGAVLHVVYAAPPSDRNWGLARDTRRSLIDPSAWNAADDPALYYYLLDLEENWPGGAVGVPGEDPDLVRWSGDPLTTLPGRLSAIPEAHRYVAPPVDPSWIDRTPPVITQPRLYADPNGPLPPRPS